MTTLEDYDAALADLKKTVAEFMDDAKALALHKIDKIQADGADIVGDHIRITKSHGPILVPRDFIAAFADQMKYEFAWVRQDDTERLARIKFYYFTM